MAYRTDIGARNRGGAIIAVIAIHAALLFAFLNLSGAVDVAGVRQPVLQLFNLDAVPPPPPPVQQQIAKPKAKEGGSAPKNIRSQATPVVAPKPPPLPGPRLRVMARFDNLPGRTAPASRTPS